MTAENEPGTQVEELKSIFVISPIGKLNDDGVDFTELFLEQIVKPAAKQAGGFKVPVRADEVKAPGSITSKIVVDIVEADVCVADLTQRNPNVMYEVAIAHAAGRPVILMQQEAEPPPFDFTGERAIHYSLRVDEANQARDDLVQYLQNAHHDEADPKLASTMHPVRRIFRDLRTLAEAEPSERAIFERLDLIAEGLASLAARVDRPGVLRLPDEIARRYFRPSSYTPEVLAMPLQEAEMLISTADRRLLLEGSTVLRNELELALLAAQHALSPNDPLNEVVFDLLVLLRGWDSDRHDAPMELVKGFDSLSRRLRLVKRPANAALPHGQ